MGIWDIFDKNIPKLLQKSKHSSNANKYYRIPCLTIIKAYKIKIIKLL